MNKREAKRMACAHLAGHARSLADPLSGDDALSEEDNEKVGDALLELADELDRRAGGQL